MHRRRDVFWERISISVSLVIFLIGCSFAYRLAGTSSFFIDTENSNQYHAGNKSGAMSEQIIEVPLPDEISIENVPMTLLNFGMGKFTESDTLDENLSGDALYCYKARKNINIYSEYMGRVAQLINEERTKIGRKPMALDNDLSVLSCHRAIENAENDWFVVEDGQHIRPNGEPCTSICYYYEMYGAFGEVMGRKQETPEQIVTAWVNSPTHYQCMTSERYTRMGVGIAQDSNGRYYWVCNFMD